MSGKEKRVKTASERKRRNSVCTLRHKILEAKIET